MKTIEEAYRLLTDELLEYVADDAWDSAYSHAAIYDRMTSTSYARQSKEVVVKNDRFPSNTLGEASRAKLFLRDHHLQATGRRIWGLTFTLYPDSTFNIEYDYNKPADYDEDDGVAEPSEPTPVANLLGGLLSVSEPSAAYHSPDAHHLSTALIWLKNQTIKHSEAWGLGNESNWNLDMNEGWLRWTFADGRVVQAAVQVIGTYNTKNNSFLWGWDHPSVPQPLRRAAQHIHTLGQELGIERWITRAVNCTQDEAWQFSALAAQQDGASGAYRGDSKGTWVYMCFSEPQATAL
ncbi:DUF6882 domain-containing protein [Hydrogenophaga sp. 2FB]|uniref:DUF6882 domain-containing protein n=1 Tax=Hydrogenophaga sp. 2FB TaxID=2502187 RepID=UPI0010F568EC|nr:DUF6882 domain-containing protein [Hydrogenophaga sp. 2FB]